ncbi:HTH-like domain-containing protein, partial [Lutispora thermophila DSM 19022]
CLREDYGLIINHKKVYRLCKELDILRPQRKIREKSPKHLAKKETVSAPNGFFPELVEIKHFFKPKHFSL